MKGKDNKSNRTKNQISQDSGKGHETIYMQCLQLAIWNNVGKETKMKLVDQRLK